MKNLKTDFDQKQVWYNSGNNYFMDSYKSKPDMKLSKGIYILSFNESIGFYLQKTNNDGYEFNFKLYGLNENLVNKFIITYNNTKGNLGILLNGHKGAGKSVTSKILCNHFLKNENHPVIIIPFSMKGMDQFLSKIEQDVTIFIDEFEKVMSKDEGKSFLSVMDGSLDSPFRRVFIATSNTLSIDKNMIDRPGRFRYIVDHSDLSKETINEIVDDLLEDKTKKSEIVDIISRMKLITIDLIKSFILEVNIHKNAEPLHLAKDFNLTFLSRYSDIKVIKAFYNQNIKINYLNNIFKSKKEETDDNDFNHFFEKNINSLNDGFSTNNTIYSTRISEEEFSLIKSFNDDSNIGRKLLIQDSLDSIPFKNVIGVTGYYYLTNVLKYSNDETLCIYVEGSDDIINRRTVIPILQNVKSEKDLKDLLSENEDLKNSCNILIVNIKMSLVTKAMYYI